MHIAYLLTGTNLGRREEQLETASMLLAARCGRIVVRSSVYETTPWGNPDQPPYLNQALCMETAMNPAELLNEVLAIELSMGRVRGEKFGARIIDIDIIFFDDLLIREQGLSVPHPFLHLRRFALECMNEIAPNLVHPVFKKTIIELLLACEDRLPVAKYPG